MAYVRTARLCFSFPAGSLCASNAHDASQVSFRKWVAFVFPSGSGPPKVSAEARQKGRAKWGEMSTGAKVASVARNDAAPVPAPAPAPAAPAPASTSVDATKKRTKGALLSGLRSGKLEEAVAKMEEDTSEEPASNATSSPPELKPSKVDLTLQHASPAEQAGTVKASKELETAMATEEGKVALKELFEKLDKDSSGGISSKEWGHSVGQVSTPGHPPHHVAPMWLPCGSHEAPMWLPCDPRCPVA